MNTSSLILQGDGYQLGITPDAEAIKLDLISSSASITTVVDPQSCDSARAHLKRLAEFRLNLERSRKAVKEPVLQLGRDIDAKALEFGGEVAVEERRITDLVAGFAAEQERQRRQAEEHARQAAAEAARLQREKEQAEIDRQRAELEADRLRLEEEKRKLQPASAPSAGGGFLAQKRAREAAEQESARLEAERLAAEQKVTQLGEQIAEVTEQATDAALASTVPTVEGVKAELDFEVVDAAALYRHAPHLVQLVPQRRPILAALKAMQATGAPVVVPGLTIKESFKVSKR